MAAATHGDRWVDISESSDDDFDVQPASSFGLLIFYNVQTDAAACRRRSGSRRVMDKLGLDPCEWPMSFGAAAVVDVASAGVTTAPTVKNSDNLADVLTLTFVLVEHSGSTLGEGRVCFQRPAGKRGTLGASSVSYCPASCTRKVWEDLRDSGKVGLHVILQCLDWDKRVIAQLKQISIAHGAELYRCTGSRDARRDGTYKRHLEWQATFAKAVQRYLNFVSWRGAMPLERCPCQLGISDLHEWDSMGDPM